MKRTVTITITVENDHADVMQEVPTNIVFQPFLKPGERSILAGIVNTLLREFKADPIVVQ